MSERPVGYVDEKDVRNARTADLTTYLYREPEPGRVPVYLGTPEDTGSGEREARDVYMDPVERGRLRRQVERALVGGAGSVTVSTRALERLLDYIDEQPSAPESGSGEDDVLTVGDNKYERDEGGRWFESHKNHSCAVAPKFLPFLDKAHALRSEVARLLEIAKENRERARELEEALRIEVEAKTRRAPGVRPKCMTCGRSVDDCDPEHCYTGRVRHLLQQEKE